MSDIRSLFTPGVPTSLPIRPLNKGMILNLPSNVIPDEAVLDAKNYIVNTGGLTRRPGLGAYSSNAALYPPVRDVVTFWQTDGTQITVLIDAKLVYVVSNGALTPKYNSFATASHLTASGLYLIASAGAAPNWDTLFNARDLVYLSHTSLNEMVTIEQVVNSRTLLLDAAPTNSYGAAAVHYAGRRVLRAVNPYLIDWTIADNKLILADTTQTLRSFDGTTFQEYDATLTFKPTAVTHFLDRIWCGRIQDLGYFGHSGYDYRQRITWSRTTDKTDFTSSASSAANFLDLPYSSGYIRRLVGLGSVMVAYLTDAMYIGRPTQYAGDSLPLSFERFETGGVGLVGMKAVAPWLRGHFFIGDDDIYYFSNSGLERIGTPIIKETIKKSSNLWAAYVTPDPLNNRVVFGFPSDAGTITKIWSFDYTAKSWGYDEISCSMLALAELYSAYTWNTLSIPPLVTAQTWDTGMGSFVSWDAIGGTGSGKALYIGVSDMVFKASATLTADSSGAISCRFVTKDFDFDEPDSKKTVYRFAMKLADPTDSDLSFTVRSSTDKGRHWKSLGTFNILTDDDEGHVDFRVTGSTIRFEVTSSSMTAPYTISEITLRVKKRGAERIYGPED